MPKAPKTIGIFGGTFDPVHNGHLSIARSFLASGCIDALWVCLNPSPPHKRKHRFAPFAKRLEMLEATFDSLAHVLISDLELRLPKPSYTVQTITHLKKVYPDHTFYICMGKDSFLSFTSWYKWQEIVAQAKLLVADRPVETSPSLPKKLIENAHFVDHKAKAISSSNIREKIEKGESISQLVPASVLRIIKRDNLYAND